MADVIERFERHNPRRNRHDGLHVRIRLSVVGMPMNDLQLGICANDPLEVEAAQFRFVQCLASRAYL